MSSLHNPHVLAARKLARRHWREKERRFLIEGPVAVRDALATGAVVTDVFVRAPEDEFAPLIENAESRGATVHLVSDRVVAAIADARTPQGVVAIAEMHDAAVDLLDDATFVLVLAEVRDPGNVGTLIRSAAAAGTDAVVVTKGSVDAFHPKTVRACSAAIFRVPVVRDAALAAVAERLRARDVVLVGADARAPRSMYDADLTGRKALVLGNEAWGFSDEARASVDETVAIPMPGGVDSLNVAVAGSVLLFEAVRQRHAPASA